MRDQDLDQGSIVENIKGVHDFMKVDTNQQVTQNETRVGSRASKRSRVRSGSFGESRSGSGSNSRSNSLSKGSANAKMMTEIGANIGLKKQKKKKLPQIEIDTNSQKLRSFFKSISVNLKMD